jgi:hypothetical protein
MEVKIVKSFTATIYVGLKIRDTGVVQSVDEIHSIAQSYCNREGDCITISNTDFIYKNGGETGVAIGFIQYPRFIRDEDDILDRALRLAEKIMNRMQQYRVTVVCSDETYMLSNENLLKETPTND